MAAQVLVNGLLLGGLLALVGLGFSLVWGILNIVNLAHAAFIMFGAYITFFLFNQLQIDPFLSLPISIGALFLVGFVLQNYVINLVMRAPLLVTFVLTFGFQTFFTSLARLLFTGDQRSVGPAYNAAALTIGDTIINWMKLGGFVVALLVTAALFLFMRYTRTGNAIRAVGLDADAARLMGVNVPRIYALTYAISAGLAAVAGTLISTWYSFTPELVRDLQYPRVCRRRAGRAGQHPRRPDRRAGLRPARPDHLDRQHRRFPAGRAEGGAHLSGHGRHPGRAARGPAGAGGLAPMNLAIMILGLVLSLLTAQRARPAVSRVALGALALLLIAAPLVTNNLLTLTNLYVAALAAIGWNIIGGFTGYAAFGQSAFFGLGGYTAAVMVSRAPGTYGLPNPLGVLVGGIVPAVAAVAIGAVVLRLRGHYFAIATLGIGIAVRELVNNVDCVGFPGLSQPVFCLGAASGIILPPVRHADLQVTNLTFYFGALVLLVLGLVGLVLLNRSKFGYGLRAIRANEEAAGVMGINTTRFKIAAFAASAVLTGLAGGVQALVNGSVLPDTTSIFDPYLSLEVIIICLIGGVGTVWGPIIGTFALFAVEEGLVSVFGGGDWRPVFFGAFVILLILFLPRGILQLVGRGGEWRWRSIWRNLVANRV